MSQRHLQRFSVAVAAFGTLTTLAHHVSAGSYVFTEAVNSYTSCFSGSDLSNRLVNASGFGQQIAAPPPTGSGLFAYVGYLTDMNVTTKDFYDPQKTGMSYDTDLFDSGWAFAMYSGHGTGVVGDTPYCGYIDTGVYTPPFRNYCAGEQLCGSASDCNSPLAGTYDPGICRRIPGETFGHCSYKAYDRRLQTGNCSASNPRGFDATVNMSLGDVAWGEVTNWAGAGTNGMTSVVIMDISFAHGSCG